MSNANLLDQPTEIAPKRRYPAIRHNLYEIDFERRTAFCTACGYTEIHIKESRNKQSQKAICINRYREVLEMNKGHLRLRRGRKPTHSLSEIDPLLLTAVCSVCGLTKIDKRVEAKATYYSCATSERAYARKYHRNYYSSRSTKPLAHVLSQIDENKKTAVCSQCGYVSIYIWQGERKVGRRCSNASVRRIPQAQKIRREINTTMINRYKVEHGCRRCGYNENPSLLHLYSGNPNKKELKIDKLLRLTSNELIQELARCEVFCANCRSFVNYELVLENLKSLVDY